MGIEVSLAALTAIKLEQLRRVTQINCFISQEFSDINAREKVIDED